MAVSTKKIFIAGTALGVVAYIVTWFTMSEASPMYDYFLKNPGFLNFWGALNFPAFVITLLFNLPDNAFTRFIIIFAQWFLLGCSGYATFEAVLSLRNKE